MKELYDPSKPGDLPRSGDLETILRLAVLRSGFGAGDREFVIEKARKIVRTYLQQADAQDAEATVGVEVSSTYDVTVGGEVMYQLSARLDRVLVMDNVAAAIDYKIGGALPPVNGILVNLAALKAAHPTVQRWEFWLENLSDDGVERTIYRGEDFKGAIKGLTAQVRRYQAAAEGNYPATVNEGCVWCPLRDMCDAVAVRRISEEELEF